MHRTTNSFTVLQAIAATVGMALVLWSLGLSAHFAQAANVTSFSDTLSDSAPSVGSNHTITFTTPTGVANGETIVLDFSDGPFVMGAVGFTDVDLATTSDYTITGSSCGAGTQIAVSTTVDSMTFELCAAESQSIPANSTTTIQIGTNADAGSQQITNPGLGSHQINITAGASDEGSTEIAIVDSVTVTATVDTLFTFAVNGVAGGETVNTADTTGGTTTATAIPFGALQSGVASTAAQDLVVTTNSANGFVVTVAVDQQLTSGNGADIDGFVEGSYTETATAWAAPSPVAGSENTYGHWGLTSEDNTLSAGLSDTFNYDGGGDRFVSASTTPIEVFRNDGPTDGVATSTGRTRVGYKVEITQLQEAADDYQATLTYVATPVF